MGRSLEGARGEDLMREGVKGEVGWCGGVERMEGAQ